MPLEPNTFAASNFDRAAERRQDTDWIARALDSDDSLALLATTKGVPLSLDGKVTLPLGDALGLTGQEPEDAILLGVEADGTPLFALDAEDTDPGDMATILGPGARIRFLRDAAMHLSADEAGLLAYTSAILNWQRNHRFCGRCGTPTEARDGGHARHCPKDGTMNYPRTDPVIICIVGDGDRVLMGRQPSWPKGRWSALAGFVEPGESFEDAVAREIDEEAGISVTDIRYHSSQPWPFPGSLMTGFIATYDGGEAHTRDQELEAVGWFDRDEVRAATAEDGWEDDNSGKLMLPPRIAIARRLIESWLDAS